MSIEVIDRKSNEAIYIQLHRILVSLLSRDFKHGMKFISEHQIARKYQISRPTVREALKEMVNDDLLIKSPGKGCYVNEPFGNISSKPQNIVVLIKTREFELDPYHHAIIKGVNNTGIKHGYLPFIFYLSDNPNHDDVNSVRYCQLLKNMQIDGLIIIDRGISDKMIKYIAGKNVKTVLIDRDTNRHDISKIMIDHFDGIYCCCAYLAFLKHKNVGILLGSHKKGNPNYESTCLMNEGYLRAAKDFSLNKDEKFIRYNVNNDSDMKKEFEIMMSANPRPTCIIALYQGIYTLIDLIKEKGLKIPEDISVIAYCNVLPSDSCMEITSFEIPLLEIGSKACSLSQESEPKTLLIRGKIKKGETCNEKNS